MDIKQIDNQTWSVDGNEIWYHTVKKVYFCWGCWSYECQHVKAINEYRSAALSASAAGRGGEEG